MKAIIMPRQGQSVESCIITRWHKSEGDTVAVGDVLFSYETDKAAFEEESTESGTLLSIFFEEGSDVPCLTNVCAIGEAGEDASSLKPSDADDSVSAAVVEAAAETVVAAPVQAVETVAAQVSGGHASPRAKVLAARAGVDVTAANGTGPYGRIIERDIDALIASGGGKSEKKAVSGAQLPEFDVVPLSNVRKFIAKSMHQSLSTMAQLTSNSSFDISDIQTLREKLKKAAPELKITINDIILFAVSRVLKNHRDLNAHFSDTEMKLFNVVNMGVAMDTPRGLLVPVIFGADSMSLSEISAKTKELSAMAQSGSISPDLMSNGTFTVTNLGTFGVESFTPVINPPQTGILGVNTITHRIKADGTVYPSMTLSITFDHRAIDGAPTARFLKELCGYLENFSVNVLLDGIGL